MARTASSQSLLATNWVALQTIVVREVRRFMRIWAQTLLPPVITMVMYFLIFGSFLGNRIGQIDGFGYIQYIAPGLIMMSIITNSYNNVVSSFYSSKFQRNVEELLVAPVSFHTILIGYMIGGVLRGVLVGLLVLVVRLVFTNMPVHHLGLIVLVILMNAGIFSMSAFINAIFARSFDDISIIPVFVLTPLTYLGGEIYSIHLLSPLWQKISLANPILHMINAFRYGFLGTSDIGIGVAVAFMAAATVVLYGVCIWLLRSGRGLSS